MRLKPLNARERAVETAIFYTMALGGIVFGLDRVGHYLEDRAEVQNGVTQADIDHAYDAEQDDLAMIIGSAILAGPGTVRFMREGLPEAPPTSINPKM